VWPCGALAQRGLSEAAEVPVHVGNRVGDPEVADGPATIGTRLLADRGFVEVSAWRSAQQLCLEGNVSISAIIRAQQQTYLCLYELLI